MTLKKIINDQKLINSGLLINGKWLNRKSTFEVVNPANNQVIIEIAKASEKDVHASITSSHTAFLKWKKTTAKERYKILRKWHDLIMDNINDLAKIVTLECGKPIPEAIEEITYGANYIEWFCEEAKRTYGDIIPSNSHTRKEIITKEPVGVCAAITPWNFPSAMLVRKAAAALAAGCTMIVKPSSQTPLSTLALGYLALKSGIPGGVLNIINGDSEMISNILCESEIVRKVTFTGSTQVGASLYQKSATTIKKMSLELGGNAPFIVFDDADIDLAIENLMKAKFRNAGQTCICANRIFVANSIHDEFIRKLSLKIKKLKVGNGLEPNIDIGPLINNHALNHAIELIKDALKNGANLICGGKVHKLGGNFLEPTLISGCNKKMRVFHEEIFAPVLPVYKFKNDDEVIALANDTPYGLASYLFSTNIKRIFKVADSLEYGMVGVNAGRLSGENVPFGGIKLSGVGREGSHYGIDEYLNIKYICLDLH